MSFRKAKKAVIYSLASIVAFLLIFLLKFNTIEETGEKRMLRISLPEDIRSLDPAFAFENNSSHIVNMVFEGLMRRGVDDVPQLAIAKNIDISRDQTHYVFHLRDCNWSDGVPITAYDFEFAWKRALDPNTKAVTQVPYYFYPIKNAKLSLSGKLSVDKVCVHAIDAKTLAIDLEYPSPYFLDIVALPYFYPIPKHAIEEDSNWGNNENLVCNGPFTLKSWKKGNRIEVVKNLNYWDQENVHLDGININIVGDSNTSLLLYEKGSLDWVGAPFDRMSCDVSSLDRSKESVHAYWFFANTEKYPLNNQKLRKALSYAIDRKSIVDNVFHDSGEPAMSLLSPPLRLRIGHCFEDNNVSGARKLFEEALYELGISEEDLPEIELSYVADLEIHTRIAQAVQDQLKKALNVKIGLRKAGWAVHYDSVSSGDYDLGFMGWFTSVLDSSFILENFKNKGDNSNKCRWENAQYKKCLDQANITLNQMERVRLLREAEDILIEEMPIIPLCFVNQRFAKNPRLKGENLSALHFIDFKSAYFEDDE